MGKLGQSVCGGEEGPDELKRTQIEAARVAEGQLTLVLRSISETSDQLTWGDKWWPTLATRCKFQAEQRTRRERWRKG